MNKELKVVSNKPAAVGDDVAVPDDIFIRCPAKNFGLRQARMCDKCAHFKGMVVKLGNSTMPFQSQFNTQCAHPITRELFAVELHMD